MFAGDKSSNTDGLAFASPAEVYSTLRDSNIRPLIPMLGADAEPRIADADLTVSELLVAARWLGMARPEEIFRAL